MKNFFKFFLVTVLALSFVPVVNAQTAVQNGDVDPDGGSACLDLTMSLRYRDTDAKTNGQISLLQDFLVSEGYITGNPTGYFGLATFGAVKKFQTKYGFSSTGFVGPLTREKIKEITCNGGTIEDRDVIGRMPLLTIEPNNIKIGQITLLTVKVKNAPANAEVLLYSNNPNVGQTSTKSSSLGRTNNLGEFSISEDENYTTNEAGTHTYWVVVGGLKSNSVPIEVSSKETKIPYHYDFTASPNTGNAPLWVNFSAFVQQNLGYRINFGDGTKGDMLQKCTTSIPPSCSNRAETYHTYDRAGTYTASLYKLNTPCPDGFKCPAYIDTKPLAYVTVTVGSVSGNRSPKIVGFPAVPTNIQPNQMVHFNFTANDPDNDDLAWSFNFGDSLGIVDSCSVSRSQNGKGANMTIGHQWNQVGTYEVTAKVSDCQGGSDSYRFSVTVGNQSGNRPPVISGVTAPTTLKVGETGTWTVRASDPENGSLSYAVNWMDTVTTSTGVSSSSFVPNFVQSATFTHSYATAGTYTVNFTVKDDAGQVVNTSATVVVSSTSSTQPSTTLQTDKSEYKVGETVVFKATVKESDGTALTPEEGAVVSIRQYSSSANIDDYDFMTFNRAGGYYEMRADDHTGTRDVGNWSAWVNVSRNNLAVGTSPTVSYKIIAVVPTLPVQPSITVLSPNGGEYKMGATDLTGDWINVKAHITNAQKGSYGLYFTERNDGSWRSSYFQSLGGGDGVDARITNPYVVDMSTQLNKNSKAGRYYALVEWVDANGQIYRDFSDSPFTITDPTTSFPPIVSSPTGPATVIAGTSNNWGFTATKADDYVTNYEISWGDGTANDVPSQAFVTTTLTTAKSHTYTTAGTYTITLTAIDSKGDKASKTTTVNVTSVIPPPPPPSSSLYNQSGMTANMFDALRNINPGLYR